ncbi:hypothetical protein TNCV_4148011 [Trichonephila clavipes]|nr:hypothetical protein TNCV_4148011 [Trichonephila clavipes]
MSHNLATQGFWVGDARPNLEPWSSDGDDFLASISLLSLLPHHTDGKTFERQQILRVSASSSTERHPSGIVASDADCGAVRSGFKSRVNRGCLCCNTSPFCDVCFTLKLHSHQGCQRRANQRLHLARDEVSDWLDARR